MRFRGSPQRWSDGALTTSLVCGAILGLLILTSRAEGQDRAFRVIVNAEASVSSLSAKDLSKIFLKKTTTWPSGLKITAVNLGVDHPVREAFSQQIHGKGAKPIERRWETLIFSGMGVPPLKLETESEVVAFVENNVDAVGYVGSATELPAGVKELEITE